MKFSSRNAVLNRAREFVVALPEIFPGNPAEFLWRFHHQLLHQPRIIGVGHPKREVSVHECQNYLPRRSVRGHLCLDHPVRLLEEIVEHGAMQVFFALEIIVEHRLIDARRPRNFIRARARQAVLGKNTLCGYQNAACRFRIRDFSSAAAH